MSKDKQIEEMANAMCNIGEGSCQECASKWDFVSVPKCDLVARATKLYNAGYRKQSEGEWKRGDMPTYGGYKCSVCGGNTIHYKATYCPNCGAKMKGGAE